MMMHVLKTTTNLREILLSTIFYFETSHSQSEGDSVHGVVERALGRAGDIFIPSQLSTLVRLACARPYRVHDVRTEDIFDYKMLPSLWGF